MNFIEYLEENYRLEYVSRGSQVKLSGQCPFCGEERADLRLYVNIETGLGLCMHCNTGFNPVKFVMAAESINAKEAIKVLNGDSESFIKVKEELTVKETSLIFPEMSEIGLSTAAAEYLAKRRISAAAINHFQLSFCPSNTIIDGEIFYTQNRIIIPIFNMAGEMVSWQGRDITGKSKMKYLFPPAFKGAEELFNINAMPSNAPYIVITEGAMGAFGWWLAGIKNVVATFGKKISKFQVDMLRVVNPKVLFMAWDTDAADKKFEFYELYGHYFPDIRIVELYGKDADELSQRKLVAALAAAKPYDWSDKILTLLK